MATSRVPAAIDALVSILGAAPGLDGVSVIDGPPTVDQADADYLYVGWQPEGETAAELTQDFNAAGARTRDEEFTIRCTIDCWTGDSDVATVRARAFELLGVVEDTIRASGAQPAAPTLGGAVLWAHLTQGLLQQANTDQGVRARLWFSVSCRARI
jgi:hypothetical protein